MLEEVERLEHHAHLLAQAVCGIVPSKDVLAIDDDAAASGRVEQVESTQECALARARGADDGDDLALADIYGDVVQHVKAAVALLQVRDADDRLLPVVGGIGGLPVCESIPAPADKPGATTHYNNKRHSPRPKAGRRALLSNEAAVIVCSRRLRRTGEYPSLALARDEQDVRIEIAVGEEHLFLPLLGDADGSHG